MAWNKPIPPLSESRKEDAGFKELLGGVKIPIFVISQKTNRIRYLNTKAEELLQRSSDTIVGHQCWDIISDSCDGNCPIKQKGHLFDYKEMVLPVGGQNLYIMKSVSSIDFYGEPCFLETIVDISELKIFQNKLSHLSHLETEMLKQIPLPEKHLLVTDYIVQSLDAVYCSIWMIKEKMGEEAEFLRTAESGVKPDSDKPDDTALLSQKQLDRIAAGKSESFSGDYHLYGKWLEDQDKGKIGFFMAITKDPLEESEQFFFDSITSMTSQVIINSHISHELESALKKAEKTVALMEGQEIRLQQIEDKRELLSSRYDIAYPMQDPDGHGIQFESEAAREKVLAMMEEAETARRELIESNEQLSLIKQAINSSSDAVAISTISGEFFYINQTFTDLFGYNIALLAWLSLDSLMTVPSHFQKALSSASSGAPWRKQMKMINNDDKKIDIYLRCSPFKDEKGDILGIIWNFTDITLQKANERKIREYTKKIEKDLAEKKNMLEKAALLQESLIHRRLPLTKEIIINGMFMPCETLGGDFFRIQKGLYQNKLVIILGDCTGHGIESSMDASLLTSLVDSNLSIIYENRTDLFLTRISQSFMEMSDEDQFPTMFAMVIDLEENILYYSNANSEIPFLIRSGGIRQLDRAAGMHIGYFAEPEYERKMIKLEQGDSLLLFSDAVIDIEKTPETRLGYAGLKSMIHDTLNGGEGAFGDFLNRLYRENGKFPLIDDTTLILLEYCGSASFSYTFSTIDQWRSNLDDLRDLMRKKRYDYDEIEQFSIAMDEMCLNAIKHGNRNDPARHVLVEGEVNGEWIRARVEDQGQGFDPSVIPDPVANLDEILNRGIEEEYTHGRGVRISSGFVDELTYNSKGNSVLLKKSKSARYLVDHKKWTCQA